MLKGKQKVLEAQKRSQQAVSCAVPANCTLKRFGKLCLNMLEVSVKSRLFSLQNRTNSKARDALWKS